MTPASDGTISPTLEGKELGSMVSLGTEPLADLTYDTFCSVPGAHLTLEQAIALSRHLLEREGADGLVVTQGTDTLEEVAFLFDLFNTKELPVVFTGAMRGPTARSSDFEANLVDAIRLACSEQARGLGTLVVMNGEVHSARLVQKRHTTGLGAFVSPNHGPIGWLSEDRLRLGVIPRRTSILDVTRLKGTIPRVPIYRLSLGDDGHSLELLAAAGIDGLVIEAFGAGHVSPPVRAVIRDVVNELPVVLTSRIGVGEVLKRTYGFKGSEKDLLDLGLIWGSVLTGLQARIVMILGLMSGLDRNELVVAFRDTI